MNKTKGKDSAARFLKDRMDRLKQSSIRPASEGLPALIEDPTNPGTTIPEAPEEYPAEEGAAPTGVGSDGTTPYSEKYYKQMEKRPPGVSVREDWDKKKQPEEAIPVDKKGQVKRLLRHLRMPSSS